jgi:hypothetical protein
MNYLIFSKDSGYYAQFLYWVEASAYAGRRGHTVVADAQSTPLPHVIQEAKTHLAIAAFKYKGAAKDYFNVHNGDGGVALRIIINGAHREGASGKAELRASAKSSHPVIVVLAAGGC